VTVLRVLELHVYRLSSYVLILAGLLLFMFKKVRLSKWFMINLNLILYTVMLLNACNSTSYAGI